jgi:hypothetical protein
MSIQPSGPIPKFVSTRGTFGYELRNQRDTSNFMILVRFLDLKFLSEIAATMIGTSNPPHYQLYDSSAPFEPEVRDRICRTVCANFGFGALL